MQTMLKISPSADLVQHEWDKHGTCSGLSQAAYFAAAAQAVATVKIPHAYEAPERRLTTTPDGVRQSFLEANRSVSKDGLIATCSGDELAEVWVCLDRNLGPRACSIEARKRHCGARKVTMRAVRGAWRR